MIMSSETAHFALYVVINVLLNTGAVLFQGKLTAAKHFLSYQLYKATDSQFPLAWLRKRSRSLGIVVIPSVPGMRSRFPIVTPL